MKIYRKVQMHYFELCREKVFELGNEFKNNYIDPIYETPLNTASDYYNFKEKINENILILLKYDLWKISKNFIFAWFHIISSITLLVEIIAYQRTHIYNTAFDRAWQRRTCVLWRYFNKIVGLQVKMVCLKKP